MAAPGVPVNRLGSFARAVGIEIPAEFLGAGTIAVLTYLLRTWGVAHQGSNLLVAFAELQENDERHEQSDFLMRLIKISSLRRWRVVRHLNALPKPELLRIMRLSDANFEGAMKIFGQGILGALWEEAENRGENFLPKTRKALHERALQSRVRLAMRERDARTQVPTHREIFTRFWRDGFIYHLYRWWKGE